MGFSKGDRVYYPIKGLYGETTGKVSIIGGYRLYQVRFDDNTFKDCSENTLNLVINTLSPEEQFLSFQLNDAVDFRRLMTHIRISQKLTNIVYSMKYGDVEFLPYQFKPVFKFISSNEGRLLIADEVGLGKTIEALYIWKELQARTGASRLLVVSPAMLRTKWQRDMSNHFGIDARIVDANELLYEIDQEHRYRNKSFALITSIQGIRYKGSKEKKDDARSRLYSLMKMVSESSNPRVFDMVIIDEAHYLVNSGTASFSTASLLQQLSDNLILLSATPINNRTDDFYNLLRLLSPEFENKQQFGLLFEQNRPLVNLANCFYMPSNSPEEIAKKKEKALSYLQEIDRGFLYSEDPFFSTVKSELDERLSDGYLRMKTYDQLSDRYFYSHVFSRSRKRDVMEKASVRSAQTVGFRLSKLEYRVYEECIASLRRKAEDNADNRLYTFMIMSRQRELASCIPAAIIRWREILGGIDERTEDDESLEYDSDEDGYSSLESIPEYCIRLTEEELNELVLNDSKYDSFLRSIRKCLIEESKIIVFSFFRKTIEYLYSRLNSDGVKAIRIMGGMDQSEKDLEIARFQEQDDIKVLISSEVGAEGLDLQFASIEYNYDLPWNPMKLEQRIGRIDRIGQKAERIRIVNMSCMDTIEDRILDALYDKLDIFRCSIGELDDILGKYTMQIEYSLLESDLTEKEREAEALRMIDVFHNNLLSKQMFEESAGLSQAYSDSIISYINQSDKNSRYIKREDLINYISDYLEKYGNGSSFCMNRRSMDYWILDMSERDAYLYSLFLQQSNINNASAKPGKRNLSFPQGKRDSNYEAIDVNHPLIKWINHEMSNKQEIRTETDRAFCISIKYNDIEHHISEDGYDIYPKGAYVFSIQEWSYDCLKTRKELVYAISSLEYDINLVGPEAEKIINDSIFIGHSVTDLGTRLMNIDHGDIKFVLDLVMENIRANMDEAIKEARIENQSIYSRMRSKTINLHEKKLAELTSQLEVYKAEAAKGNKNVERVILPTEGRIRKEKERYSMELNNLQKEEVLSTSIVALGFLFVD